MTSENTQSIIRAINISGLRYIDESVVRSAILKTQAGTPLVEQFICDDITAIAGVGCFSYVSAKIDPIDDGFAVTFIVEEFPIVQDIRFVDDKLFPLDGYRRSLRTQPGIVLNLNDLNYDLDYLEEIIKEDYGYVVRTTTANYDEGILYIGFTPAKLSEIRLEGNAKTKDYVIMRQLRLESGEFFNVQEVKQGLRRVLMLGLFDDSSADTVRQEDEPDAIDITVKVKERKTGAATFGVAYTPSDGLLGYIDVAESNFLGRAQQISGNLQLGKTLRSIRLGFYEPYLLSTGMSFRIGLHGETDAVTKDISTPEGPLTGTKGKIGGEVTLTYPVSDYSRARVTLAFDASKYIQNGAPSKDWFKDYRKSVIGLGMNTNTTDNPFSPTEGFKNDVFFEVGTGLLGGETTALSGCAWNTVVTLSSGKTSWC